MAVLACDAGTLLLIFAPKLILAKQGHGLGDSATQAHTCAMAHDLRHGAPPLLARQ